MSKKIEITLDAAAGLLPSLQKLSKLNCHAARDAWALMRTEDLLSPQVADYSKTMVGAMKKHGAKGSLDPLRNQVAEAKAGKTEMKPETLKLLEQRIEQAGPFEQFTLLQTDPGHAAYVAEAKELAESKVELFLDHRIPVKLASLPDGYFASAEMRALNAVVEFIEVEARPGV